jgi:N-glycosylase/DNA lyase
MNKTLLQKYAAKKEDIKQRISDFDAMKGASDEDLYAEMAFCMLTPQSKAKQCWAAIEEIRKKDLLLSGDTKKIKEILRKRVRFHNNKARYMAENKELFMKNRKLSIKKKFSAFESEKELRSWLVKNIKGYGWKEASHFLRNAGLGEDMAILDRHILKNLAKYGIIDDVPKTLTPKKYEEIEGKMVIFCKKEKIPMSHLDLLFWSEETGEIFK